MSTSTPESRSTSVFRVYAAPYFELALKYFEEGRGLIERDLPQACGKLYRAVEEAVKGLAVHFNLRDIIESADKSGEWSEEVLIRAVEKLSRILGDWVLSSWDTAWALNTLCSQGGKFSVEDVKSRLPSIEMLISVAQNVSRVIPMSFLVEYIDRVLVTSLLEKMRIIVREEVAKLGYEVGRLESVTSRRIEELSREVESIKSGFKSRLNFIRWLLCLRKRLFSE